MEARLYRRTYLQADATAGRTSQQIQQDELLKQYDADVNRLRNQHQLGEGKIRGSVHNRYSRTSLTRVLLC